MYRLEANILVGHRLPFASTVIQSFEQNNTVIKYTWRKVGYAGYPKYLENLF